MLTLEKRPKLLRDIIGQNSIKKEFQNRLSKGKIDIPQSILFSGNTGTGKSTLAFIIAKVLNCKNPKLMENNYFEPCNECDSCRDVNNEKFARDIKFIDCSKYDKESVNELENQANIMSSIDKNKIFILDEFQELSAKAKSAVLKLLEKSRKNVYFIACTMDANSVSQAIKDRFQHYKLKLIEADKISEYLFSLVIDNENIPEEFIIEGIHIISYNSKGSLRNALSILERCLFGELYTKKQIEQELDLISEEKILNILIGLLKKDIEIIHDFLSLSNIEEFYYKSRIIMMDAKIYKLTGSLKEHWKEQSSKKLIQFNIEELLDIYFQSLNNYNYIDSTRFIFNILNKYFKEKNIRIGCQSISELPEIISSSIDMKNRKRKIMKE